MTAMMMKMMVMMLLLLMMSLGMMMVVVMMMMMMTMMMVVVGIHLINNSRDVTSVGEIQRSFLFSFEKKQRPIHQRMSRVGNY